MATMSVTSASSKRTIKSKVSIVHSTVPDLKLSHSNVGKNKKRKSSIKRLSTDEQDERVTEFEPPEIRLSRIGIVAKTPLELDLEIQSERLLHVLDSTIKKFQIVAALPQLLEDNGEELKKHLTPTEVNFIVDVCASYQGDYSMAELHASRDNCEISNVIDKISIYGYGKKPKDVTEDKRENRKKVSQIFKRTRHLSSVSKDSRREGERTSRRFSGVGIIAYAGRKTDDYLSHVVNIIYRSPGLRKFVNGIDACDDPNVNMLISGMQSLKCTAMEKLCVSAAAEREREKSLKLAWKEHTEAEEEMRALTRQLQKQRDDLGDQLIIKESLMYEHEKRFEVIQQQFKANVKKIIEQSEKEMMQESQASEVRREELTEEAERVENQYNSLLEDHLVSEKNLRTKRYKVETQLASWLTKYDTDIGERHAELEELTKCYNEENAELEALQEKFDEQDEEYTVLMAEKEEVETRIFQEKAFKFLMNRSARRIQRCWRAYRERKALRKKSKKGKGKQKSGKRKEPPKKEVRIIKQDDPNAVLQSAFKGELLEEITNTEFGKKEVVVDL